jgi:hypothetical protein
LRGCRFSQPSKAKLAHMVNDSGRRSRESSIASGWTVEGAPEESASDGIDRVNAAGAGEQTMLGAAADSTADQAGDRPAEEAPSQLSNGSVVLLGLLGGVYLLYTVVWFSWANYYSVMNSLVAAGSGSLGGVLQQVIFWIAPLAPALWFVTVLVLCRGAKIGKIALWLIVGAVLLVPLPMFEGVI